MKKQGRKLSDKDKDKIANKVVTSKGDTSKSDDRYAYEELDHLRALVEKKEVKVKDTKKVVDAIRAYDKSKDASRDATYDTDEGDKEKAAIEKKYAAKERGEIDKDDPNWKKKKYHTGIHGEEVEALKRLIESGKFSDEEIETMAWDIYEADTYAAQLARFEAGRQKRMKASGTYERPKWIPKDQDHSDDYGSSKGKKTTKEGYQRNPEKGEAEERKAERDRKASGRMPPRGDKRREDFEKWYAANVR